MQLQQKGHELCKGKRNRGDARELQLPQLNGDEPEQTHGELKLSQII